MILQAPTGSYLSLLPKGPDDPTSVIYTISAGPPPRSIGAFQKIPTGIMIMPRPKRQFTDAMRRAVLGDLVYTTKTANPVKATGGSKLFSYGQVLDFTDVQPDSLILTQVSDQVATKHNNNYIDNTALGLDDDDQQLMADQAVAAQRVILDQIADLQKQRMSLGVDITSLQGQINDATKIINGLNAIATSGGSVTTIQSKINVKINTLNTLLTNATNAYNLIPDQIEALRNSLTTLTDLVK